MSKNVANVIVGLIAVRIARCVTGRRNVGKTQVRYLVLVIHHYCFYLQTNSIGELQGHKSWCGLPYGEEDLDWSLTEFHGKGLGVMAKRLIPLGYRIMVDKAQHEFAGKDDCICTTLFNHSCDPNAFRFVDSTYKVIVILEYNC